VTPASRAPPPKEKPHPVQAADPARIAQLTEQVFAFAFGKEQNEKRVAVCDELLPLLNEATKSRDKALVLTLRAAAHKVLNQYDSALQDLTQAGEVAHKHGHRDLLSEVHRRLPEVRAQIIKKNKDLSAGTAAGPLGEGEWDTREFSTVWSGAAQAQVPVEKIACLCRYRFDGPRREIRRIFRYGENMFAYIVEVS